MFDVLLHFSHVQFVGHVKLSEDDDLFCSASQHSILEDLKITVKLFHFESKARTQFNTHNVFYDRIIFYLHFTVQNLRQQGTRTN